MPAPINSHASAGSKMGETGSDGGQAPVGSTPRLEQGAQFAAVEPDPAALAATVEDDGLGCGAVDAEQGALVTRTLTSLLVLFRAETSGGQASDLGPAESGQGVEFAGIKPNPVAPGAALDRHPCQRLWLELDVLAFRAGHDQKFSCWLAAVKNGEFFSDPRSCSADRGRFIVASKLVTKRHEISS